MTDYSTASSTLRRILSVLMPISMLLVLVTCNVHWASNNIHLHMALFDRHDVSQRSGIASSDLKEVSRDIQEYFRGDQIHLTNRAKVGGKFRTLFSPQEVLHMTDVKGLFDITTKVRIGSTLFVLLMMLIGGIRLRTKLWPLFLQWLRHAAALTILLVLLIGALTVVAFGPLFNTFHKLGFRNDLWQLDPRADLLVQIFPFGFWRDVVLLIGMALIVQALIFFLVGYVGSKLSRPRRYDRNR